MARKHMRKRKRTTTRSNPALIIVACIVGMPFLIFLFTHFVDVVNSVLFITAACLAAYCLWIYCSYEYRVYLANKRNWANSTLENLRSMEAYEFEKYVAWLYEKQGFWTTVTAQSKDGGVDVYLHKDFLKQRVVGIVQCKRYKEGNTVKVTEVRELFGSHPERNIYFAVVTTSDFTRDAYEETRSGKLPVDLVNGQKLLAMIRKLRVG